MSDYTAHFFTSKGAEAARAQSQPVPLTMEIDGRDVLLHFTSEQYARNFAAALADLLHKMPAP